MRTHLLKTELWLPRPRATIFEFFSNPRNLQRLTPPWLDFEILTPALIEMKIGTVFDYRLKIRGVPIRWQSKISVWEPPARFVDEQIQGPYRLWRHEHTFHDQSGGTLVGDRVEYSAPGGWLVQKFLVGPDLERIFEYRHKTLMDLFNRHTPDDTKGIHGE